MIKHLWRVFSLVVCSVGVCYVWLNWETLPGGKVAAWLAFIPLGLALFSLTYLGKEERPRVYACFYLLTGLGIAAYGFGYGFMHYPIGIMVGIVGISLMLISFRNV